MIRRRRRYADAGQGRGGHRDGKDGPGYQWTPRIRCASATASVDAFCTGAFSPSLAAPLGAAAESGKTL